MDKLSHMQGVLGTAMTLLALYRDARDAFLVAHPDADLPDDATLIALLSGSSQDLVAHADALLKKYGAPSP